MRIGMYNKYVWYLKTADNFLVFGILLGNSMMTHKFHYSNNKGYILSITIAPATETVSKFYSQK